MAGPNAAAVEAMKSIMTKLIQGGGFSRHLNKVKILDGGNGSVTARMVVQKEHCNPMGNMHGAFTALIVDNLSGLGLLTYPNVESAGVSVHINLKYQIAAAMGEEVIIKSRTDKVGKQFAFLTTDILKPNGDLVASGTHTKFIARKGGDDKTKGKSGAGADS